MKLLEYDNSANMIALTEAFDSNEPEHEPCELIQPLLHTRLSGVTPVRVNYGLNRFRAADYTLMSGQPNGK